MYQLFLTLQYIGIFILATELIYTYFQNDDGNSSDVKFCRIFI